LRNREIRLTIRVLSEKLLFVQTCGGEMDVVYDRVVDPRSLQVSGQMRFRTRSARLSFLICPCLPASGRAMRIGS